MKQNDKFNNILNECLDRMLKGEPIEQCLRRFPELAQELEPLLRTASAARIASTIQPRPEFKAKARYEFQSALREMTDTKAQRRSFFSWHWRWQSGWAIAVIALAIVVLGGGGTVAAASNSMPDNSLYPVKLATEQVQLALTSSNVTKTELNAKFADRRANEIVYLASKGDVKQVEVTAQRLSTNLENMTQLTGEGAINKAGTGTGAAATDTESAPGAGAPQIAPASPAPAENQPSLGPMIASVPTIEPTPTVESAQSAPYDSSIQATQNTSTSLSKNSSERGSEHLSTPTLSPRLSKLKQIITDNFNKRQARLEEAIQKAPANVRPTLRQALLQSQKEYKQALLNLYNTQTNGNQPTDNVP